MNWEIGIDMYTLICIKWITNKACCIKQNKFKKRKVTIGVMEGAEWLSILYIDIYIKILYIQRKKIPHLKCYLHSFTQ